MKTNETNVIDPCFFLQWDIYNDTEGNVITPKAIIEILREKVGYYYIDRTKTYDNCEYWELKCRFGGRCRAKVRNTLKKYNCNSYLKFKIEHSSKRVILIDSNFTHTHPITVDFYRSWLGPSESTRKKIIELTKQNENASYIRRKIEEAVSSRRFYDIRRSYLTSRNNQTITELEKAIDKLKDRFETVIHLDKVENHFIAATFISIRYKEKEISRDIIQIDDIMMTNEDDLPILNYSFKDENDNSQILGFSIMSSKEKDIFLTVMNDLKQFVGSPRVVIVDRLKAQESAIRELMPKTIVIFCRIHMIRSVEQTFGPQSIPYKLFHKFIDGLISRDEYIEGLKNAESSCKHKRAIQALIADIDCYDPLILLNLQLRGQRTTNVVEGLNGNIRDRLDGKRDISTVIEILDRLATEYAWRSERYLVEIDHEIYADNVIGSLAVEKLQKEVELAKKQNSKQWKEKLI